jgi:toxin HigB-1
VPHTLPTQDMVNLIGKCSKVERVLSRLDASAEPKDMHVPGFGLHAMSGDLKGFWSVVISRNWRVLFRFEGTDAHDVDFVDYH